MALLHLVCFYPEWDKRGWGSVGVGEGTGRREKVEEGRQGEKEKEREGRKAEPKGKIRRVPRCKLAYKKEDKLD